MNNKPSNPFAYENELFSVKYKLDFNSRFILPNAKKLCSTSETNSDYTQISWCLYNDIRTLSDLLKEAQTKFPNESFVHYYCSFTGSGASIRAVYLVFSQQGPFIL